MRIPTLTSDPRRFSDALTRIALRQVRREQRRAFWRGFRRRVAHLLRR